MRPSLPPPPPPLQHEPLRPPPLPLQVPDGESPLPLLPVPPLPLPPLLECPLPVLVGLEGVPRGALLPEEEGEALGVLVLEEGLLTLDVGEVKRLLLLVVVVAVLT